MYFFLLTLLLAALIAGLFGLGFAFGCRLPGLEGRRRSDR